MSRGNDSLRKRRKPQAFIPVHHSNSSTSLEGSVQSQVDSEERQAEVLGRGSLVL